MTRNKLNCVRVLIGMFMLGLCSVARATGGLDDAVTSIGTTEVTVLAAGATVVAAALGLFALRFGVVWVMSLFTGVAKKG